MSPEVAKTDICSVHGGHRLVDAPGRCDRYDYIRRCEFTRAGLDDDD